MNEQEKELIQDYKNLIQEYKLLTKDLRMLLSSVLGEEKEEENCNFVTLLKQPEKDVNSPEFEGIKKGGRWQPPTGTIYFYLIDDGRTDFMYWGNDNVDLFHFNTGNCFKSEQEAIDFKENLLTKQQLKDLALELNNGVEIDWDDYTQSKFSIFYNGYRDTQNTQKLKLDSADWYTELGQVYCLDETFLEIAKERIGEEKIIKLIESGV